LDKSLYFLGITPIDTKKLSIGVGLFATPRSLRPFFHREKNDMHIKRSCW